MLLYAVVFGKDDKEFQNNLDMFYECSKLWHFPINIDKTQIMIFGTRQDQRFNFNLGGRHTFDVCTDLKYLGVIFSRNRNFHQTKKHNVAQTRKEIHVLLNEFVILLIQLICSCIHLTMLFSYCIIWL